MFSRITTMSMPRSGRTNGRWFTYWSSAKRIFSSRPRSMTPGGTSGVPTAPSRMASKARSSSSSSSGRIVPSRR